MTIDHVLLIGVQGGFGRLFARRLHALDLRVTGVGRRERDADLGMLAEYHQADALALDEPYRRLVREADCVICCLPDEATRRAVPLVAAEMSAGAVLCDVLSVKTPIVEIMAAQRDDISLMSLHPMFAPSVDFPGQNVVVVAVRQGERGAVIYRWLEQWNARVTTLSAAEHDRLAGETQTATHAAVLAFGMTLLRRGYEPVRAEATSTPAHRTLLAQLARIVGSDPEVYWKILHDNPTSAEILEHMSRSLSELARLAADGSQAELGRAFDALRGMLGERYDALFERTTEMFERDAQERRGGASSRAGVDGR